MLAGSFRTPHKKHAFSLAADPKPKWLGHLVSIPCPAVWVNPGRPSAHVHSDQEAPEKGWPDSCNSGKESPQVDDTVNSYHDNHVETRTHIWLSFQGSTLEGFSFDF